MAHRTLVAIAGTMALVVSACASESTGPKPFSQSDLTGQWRYSALFHGPGVVSGSAAGWERGTIRIDEGGAVSIVEALDSAGGSAATMPGRLAVGEGGALSATPGGFQGKVNQGGIFAVATSTPASGVAALWILQKIVPGTSFGQADLSGTGWRYYQLSTGPSPRWEHGEATVDDSGSVSSRSRISQDGPEPDQASFATMTIGSGGLVTIDRDPGWSAALSPDKAAMVATHTASAATHEYGLNLIVRTGSTFSQRDLEGRWGFYQLVATANGGAGWTRGKIDVDAAGKLTFSSWATNTGPQPDPAPGEAALSTDGTLTRTVPPSTRLHGTMVGSKDFLVRTDTVSGGLGYAGLGFWVK